MGYGLLSILSKHTEDGIHDGHDNKSSFPEVHNTLQIWVDYKIFCTGGCSEAQGVEGAPCAVIYFYVAQWRNSSIDLLLLRENISVLRSPMVQVDQTGKTLYAARGKHRHTDVQTSPTEVYRCCIIALCNLPHNNFSTENNCLLQSVPRAVKEW